jgi:SAM-dependent methyltransferase
MGDGGAYAAAPVCAASAPTCPACGGELENEPLLTGHDRLHATRTGRHWVSRCPSCGTGVTFPLLSVERLATLYPPSYGPYDERIAGLAGVASRLIRTLQSRRAFRLPPLRAVRGMAPGRVVDVGCGRGDLAAVFVSGGWHTTGIDPSEAACAVARGRGVDARVGTLAGIRLESGAYDVAVFQHSLEHTPDPAADLERTREALRPGGLALITVPNFGSWQRRRFRGRWYHLDLPRHRTHFTSRGLASALERAGFEVAEMTTSTSAVGFPASVQYALSGRCLFPAGLALRVAAGLSALVLPVARVLDRLGGGGDQLHAVARRRA